VDFAGAAVLCGLMRCVGNRSQCLVALPRCRPRVRFAGSFVRRSVYLMTGHRSNGFILFHTEAIALDVQL
jgi:hypothetical protein